MSSAPPPPTARHTTNLELSELQPLSELPAPRHVGECIAGRYELLELIGTGGSGFVCSARHLVLDEPVALKFLRSDLAAQPEAVARFIAEARSSYRIQSPHVARVLDVGTTDDGAPFIVMERLIGCDLRSLLQAQTRLPRQYAIDCVLEICEALAAAHACQIVHRDIKPENVFVVSVPQPQIKVLDFGISKGPLKRAAAGRPVRTESFSNTASGTPRYMAPEQIRGALDLDARADIWSVGCMLYEMLSGRAPFDRPLLTQSCAAVLQEDPPALRELCPELPPGLERVILRCLEKEPIGRYASVADLALALATFGSRRARLSAERCRKRLQSSPSDVELALYTDATPARAKAATLVARPKRRAADVEAGASGPARTPGSQTAAPERSSEEYGEGLAPEAPRPRAQTRSLRRISERASGSEARPRARGLRAGPLFVVMAALMGSTLYYVVRSEPRKLPVTESHAPAAHVPEPIADAPASAPTASSSDVPIQVDNGRASDAPSPQPAAVRARTFVPREKVPARARPAQGQSTVPDVGY
jgi:serine/threonine protein kinase